MYLYQLQIVQIVKCRVITVKVERRRKRFVVDAVKLYKCKCKMYFLLHLQNYSSKLPNVFVQLQNVICQNVLLSQSRLRALEEKACCGCSCSQSQIAAKSKEGKLSAVHKNVGKLINGNVLYFCANCDRAL